MLQSEYPSTLEEAVRIGIELLPDSDKEILRFTPRETLIWFHYDWALNLRDTLGLKEDNRVLIQDCGETDADGAMMVIVNAIWQELNQPL